MGIFDFMKKKDPLDDLANFPDSNPFLKNEGLAPQDISSQPAIPSFEHQSTGFQNSSLGFPQGFPQNTQTQFSNQTSFNQPFQQDTRDSAHQFELILSKLDTIRSVLDNLHQRISLLEQKMEMDNEKRRRSW